MTIATVSINFSDGSKEILNVDSNGLGIIYEGMQAALHNRPVFSVSTGQHGYQVQVLIPGEKRHQYVSGYRNGEFKWCHDYLYAKEFSPATARKHVLELYGLK